MAKTPSHVGNRLGIMPEKAIRSLRNIGRGTPLENRVEGEALLRRPVRAPSAAVAESAQRMMDAHADTLARLAR